jgi:hypothetical protein
LVADQGHDHRLCMREAGAQFLEVPTRDDAVFVPLQEEDLGGDLGEDRPQVEAGEQAEAMGQGGDRSQPVLLQVEGPAVGQDGGEMALAVVAQDRLAER